MTPSNVYRRRVTGPKRGDDNAALSDRIDLWTYFQNCAGAQKDRMIAIASPLLAVSGTLLAFAYAERPKAELLCGSRQELSMAAAFVGAVIAFLAFLIVREFFQAFRENAARADNLQAGCAPLREMIDPATSADSAKRLFRRVLGLSLLVLSAHSYLALLGFSRCA